MSTLALNNVSYQYEGTQKVIFKDVSICFEAGKVGRQAKRR